MGLFYKPGVNERTGKKEVGYAIRVAEEVLEKLGKDCVVTSLDDGAHKDGSLHYKEMAVDFRTKHLSAPEKAIFHSEMNERLQPKGFDIVFESLGQDNEHLHCEFDPKAGETFMGVLA